MAYGFLASGNIGTSRFVSTITGSAYYVEQATASKRIVGVSQPGTLYAPGTSADSGYAGVTGSVIKVFQDGEEALLDLGGTVSAGDQLTADASGQGVAVSITATGHVYVGGIALSNGASGESIRIRVKTYEGPQAN